MEKYSVRVAGMLRFSPIKPPARKPLRKFSNMGFPDPDPDPIYGVPSPHLPTQSGNLNLHLNLILYLGIKLQSNGLTFLNTIGNIAGVLLFIFHQKCSKLDIISNFPPISVQESIFSMVIIVDDG